MGMVRTFKCMCHEGIDTNYSGFFFFFLAKFLVDIFPRVKPCDSIIASI